jgi:hypothetical protein
MRHNAVPVLATILLLLCRNGGANQRWTLP